MLSVGTKLITRLCFFLVFFSDPFFCVSQTRLQDVDTENISYQKVVSYLENQMNNEVLTFDDIHPSLPPDASTKGYHVIDREYLVKESLPAVWNHYVNTGLHNSWNSKKVHLGFTYSRVSNSLYYATEVVEGLIPGLIVFFDIKLLFGIKEIAMAFEVTQVDSGKKLIEYSYIAGNGTEGKQQLFFESTPKGYTLITHLSYYKSKPKTREGIYPHLHAQLINRFHRNMKKQYPAKID